MSMYNMLFGVKPLSDVILATLNLTRSDVGRFRDCFIAEGKVAVYTRNGGGNREDYMPDFTKHPNFLYDVDDDFDCTYATIYFSFPERYAELLKVLESGKFEPSKKWHDYLEGMKSPDYKPPEAMEKFMRQLEEFIKKGTP